MLKVLLRGIVFFLLMAIAGGCSSVKLMYKNRYIYHPYDFEKCMPGENCILVKGTYTIDKGIQLLEKENIQLDGSGSTLIMSSKSPIKNGYCIFNLRDCKNLSFSNFILDGNRQSRGCAESYAHSFIMAGCQFINLSNSTIENSVADGVFLAAGTEGDSSTFCKQIAIRNVNIDNSCRNGISIINAYDVTVSACNIHNSNGLSPAAGIDVEADTEQRFPSNKNITIESCYLSQNRGCGIMTSQKGSPENIQITSNKVDRCKIGIFVSSKLTEVANNIVNNCELIGIQSVRYDHYPVDKNHIANNEIDHTEIGIHYCGEEGLIKSNKINVCYKTGIWLNGNTLNNTSVLAEGNIISAVNDFGIYAINFGSVDVRRNRISNAQKEGISITNGISVVDSNYIQFSKLGASLTGSRSQFMANEIVDCETGISIIGGGKYKPDGALKYNKFVRVKKSWFGDFHLLGREGNTESR